MNKTKKALKLVKKVGSVGVEQNFYRWPPLCMGILHQPPKPKKVIFQSVCMMDRYGKHVKSVFWIIKSFQGSS